MRLDVRVYASSISLEMRAILGRRNLYRLPGSGPQPQDSLLAVMLQVIAAEHFRQLSRCKTPHSIHLEQSVLRRHVTLGEKEIIEVGSIDCGHAVAIANDRHWRRESHHPEPAVQLGQSRPCHGINPGADT